MLNRLRSLTKPAILTGIATACFSTISAAPVSSQILPEVWATVGSVDDLVSYGVGFRYVGTALEIGTGEEGATGADFLTFVPLPIVSPYLGLGYYTGDESIAYSGGIHISAGRRLVVGGGYHSIRGVNGKLGIRF